MGWLKLILGVHRWILISRVRDVDAAEARFFVNALSGLFLFLLFHTMDIFNNTDVCQRPKRAFFISTVNFLVFFTKTRGMCQRPKRAFFISTRPKKILLLWDFGVNALNGLSLFLHSSSGDIIYPINAIVSTP